MERTDAELVGQALAGKVEPFCALVRRYQDHAYGVALGVLADVHLAQDAAQEAFLCAYCDLPKLREPARFGAWLCGIARNTAFEVRRDRQRQDTLAKSASEVAGLGEPAPSAQRLAEESEEHALVREALLRVGEKDREALTLYYANGLSYVEICDVLSITQGTLKGRLQRGRTALREELVMVEQACKDNAPDDAFSQRLEEAISVFAAKGPSANHIPSPWHQSIHDEIRRILDAGEEGYRIDQALSHAGPSRQRFHAVTRFGLRRDARSLNELERLLEDRSARVRRQAVKWYASRIHPDRSVTGPHAIGVSADSAIPRIERLLKAMTDDNFNVRLATVFALGAYVNVGDVRVNQALGGALDDAKHKVRHAAARILHVPCPGCRRTWCGMCRRHVPVPANVPRDMAGTGTQEGHSGTARTQLIHAERCASLAAVAS